MGFECFCGGFRSINGSCRLCKHRQDECHAEASAQYNSAKHIPAVGKVSIFEIRTDGKFSFSVFHRVPVCCCLRGILTVCVCYNKNKPTSPFPKFRDPLPGGENQDETDKCTRGIIIECVPCTALAGIPAVPLRCTYCTLSRLSEACFLPVCSAR